MTFKELCDFIENRMGILLSGLGGTKTGMSCNLTVFELGVITRGE